MELSKTQVTFIHYVSFLCTSIRYDQDVCNDVYSAAMKHTQLFLANLQRNPWKSVYLQVIFAMNIPAYLKFYDNLEIIRTN